MRDTLAELAIDQRAQKQADPQEHHQKPQVFGCRMQRLLHKNNNHYINRAQRRPKREYYTRGKTDVLLADKIQNAFFNFLKNGFPDYLNDLFTYLFKAYRRRELFRNQENKYR